MNNRDDAARRLQDARLRFRETVAVARRELAPGTLARRGSTRAKLRARDAVQSNPKVATAAGVALFAFLFRKPIAGLIRRLVREKRYD